MRLDRYLVKKGGLSGKEASRVLSAGSVRVDGIVETDKLREIHPFSHISVEDRILQAREALHIILHKPAGYLCATTDPEHPTVIDLIDHPLKHELHLAGRLDRFTTGLVLLTNDGTWSKRVTEPEEKVAKVYHVTTRDDITQETAAMFRNGIYFAYEDLITQPAELEIISPREAILILHEGRYHQVKRMFHAVGNQVVKLHRASVGPLNLDGLDSGQFRHLSQEEIRCFSVR